MIRLLVALLLLAAPAFAVQPDEVLKDAGLEARARQISASLRCLQCQNQSIDDSDSPVAKDLRVLVRERLSAGASDADIQTFVVQRYGEFVLLKPVFGTHTLLLWLTPLVVLGLGAFGVWRAIGPRPAQAVAALDAGEQKALDRLLIERE